MKKLISLILTICMLTLLAACNTTGNDTGDTTAPEGGLDTSLEISISVLSGTTGMGIAPLMKSAKDGNEPLNYKITVATSADQISPLIISKSLDIAAVPTNLASVLYNKTNGGIKILAANTKGVLYLVSEDKTIDSIEDLKGKTVHVPGTGTNPEYILRTILKAKGIESEVTIDSTYAGPDELTAALTATDKVSVALLPEPKVSAAKAKNANLASVVNITEAWNEATNGAELLQGCIIVRTEFLEQHPAEVAEFLRAYEASVKSVINDPENASKTIAEMGIIPNANLAKVAIPNCNLCYITGDSMADSIAKFYQLLFDLEPKSIGGKLPDANIYYK